jgi:hypothetical protein
MGGERLEATHLDVPATLQDYVISLAIGLHARAAASQPALADAQANSTASRRRTGAVDGHPAASAKNACLTAAAKRTPACNRRASRAPTPKAGFYILRTIRRLAS